MSQLPWTDAHWARVQTAVTEEFAKSSVAGAALPCYGPLEGSVESISMQTLGIGDDADLTLRVADYKTTRFWRIAVQVALNSHQITDPTLGSALFAFRRAANYLARTEDWIVFNGHGQFDDDDDPDRKDVVLPGKEGLQGPIVVLPPDLAKVKTTRNHVSRGLLSSLEDPKRSGKNAITKAADEVDDDAPIYILPDPKQDRKDAGSLPAEGPAQTKGARYFDQMGGGLPAEPSSPTSSPSSPAGTGPYGENLVAGVSMAISRLERRGYAGPFSCIMSPKAYNEAQRPSAGSLVLPADRITPMLGGPLLRSGSMYENFAVVVANAAESVDIVVATAPRVQFLQMTGSAEYLFRVYERFALRIKDKKAVVPLLLL